MLIKLAETAHFPFSTRDPTTGSAAAPTTGPTATCYEESTGTPMAATVTVTALAATGQYSASVVCSGVNGFTVGNQYSIRVAAGFDTISDESQIAVFQVSAENHGESIDKILSTIEDNIIQRGDAAWLTATSVGLTQAAIDAIWAEAFYGVAASNLITFAAVGAGIGKVDIEGHTPGTTRVEKFRLPDDSADAFAVTVDAEGERTFVNLLP